MELELVVNGSKLSRTQWDELFSGGEHPKVPHSGFPKWYYEHNECTTCGTSLMLCKDNPYGFRGEVFTNRQALIAASREAHQRAQEEEASTKAEKKQQRHEDVESSAKELIETDAPKHGRGGRERITRRDLDENEKQEVIAKFNRGEGGVVALAKEYTVQPQFISALLKAAGCVIKRGAGAGMKKALEARQLNRREVPALTDSMLNDLVKRYKAGERIGTFVSETGIPQPMISAGLKSRGIEIRRGRQKTTA